jgi:hypothetical protein
LVVFVHPVRFPLDTLISSLVRHIVARLE